jgi:hypothetical protein
MREREAELRVELRDGFNEETAQVFRRNWPKRILQGILQRWFTCMVLRRRAESAFVRDGKLKLFARVGRWRLVNVFVAWWVLLKLAILNFAYAM